MANDGSADGARTFFEFMRPDPDKVIVGRVIEDVPKTGIDRLKRMFSLDQNGQQSKEIVMISQAFAMTAIGGGIFGGIVQSRNALVTFLENNQATKFQDHLAAKRELQRVMAVAFGKGAWRWGSRISFFCLSFTTLLTTVSVYRGKDSLVEYLVAGGVTGALFKMNMGLKGAIAGGVAGAAVSGVGGAASLLVLKLGGTSMDEMRSFAKHMRDLRSEVIRKKTAVESEDGDGVDLKVHEDDSLYRNLEVDKEEEEERHKKQG